MTIYYSFLLDVTDLTNSNTTTGGFFFSLNNTADSSQTGNPGSLRQSPDPHRFHRPTKYNLGIFGNESATAASTAWASNQLDLNTTELIVGSLNLGTKETRLWINPDPATFGISTPPTYTAHDTDTTAWSGNNVQSVLVRQNSVLAGLTMDELRVGSTWGDVTPTLSAFWDINADAGAGGTGSATPSGVWDGAMANWNLASDGTGSTQAWLGGGYKAVFSAGTDATGAYIVTVSGTQSAAAISFEDGTPTLTGGTVNVSTGVISANTGVTATIQSTFTSSAGLIKGSAGTVILSGALNYTGNTTINLGTLQIGDGTTSTTSVHLPVSSVITDNGTLAFKSSTDVTQGTDFNGAGISGTGGITQAGTGTTLTLNVPNTYTGTTIATAGTIHISDSLAVQNSTVDTSGAGSIVFDNALTNASVGGLNGANNYSANTAMNLTIGNNVAVDSFAGVIGGSGSLTKVGTSTQTLSGNNNYSGGTNINAGTLRFNTTTAMPATGTVTVNNTGTLGVRAGGAGEWTSSTDTSTGGTLGSLIAGRGGQGLANQVVWKDGSTLSVSTLNAPSGQMTYSGVIGGFHSDSGTTNNVGLTKTGSSTTLTLTGNNTFAGPLSVDNDGGVVALTTVLPNAGQTMTNSHRLHRQRRRHQRDHGWLC